MALQQNCDSHNVTASSTRTFSESVRIPVARKTKSSIVVALIFVSTLMTVLVQGNHHHNPLSSLHHSISNPLQQSSISSSSGHGQAHHQFQSKHTNGVGHKSGNGAGKMTHNYQNQQSDSSSSSAQMTSTNQLRVQKHISSQIEKTLYEIDRLQTLDFGDPCLSLEEESARHELNDLVAQVIRTPSEELLGQVNAIHKKLTEGGKEVCNYTKGLACDPVTGHCTCYTGSRHGDIFYEPVRENGTCKLDEMSRCYPPSYLVSRGATVIPCINGAKCVGDLSGRRCVSPIFTEICHCQRPCPDGSFTNIKEELQKCIARLGEISVLQYGDNCTLADQLERDWVEAEMVRMERAGPIIRGIKRILATERLLCDPEGQLVCDEVTQTCACGAEKDGIVFVRAEGRESNGGNNGSCVWAKGSRCFPTDLYENVTGSNGSCIRGTDCYLQGQLISCSPEFEEPLCFCQDPREIEGGGVLGLLFGFGLIFVLGGGGLAYLAYAKKLPFLSGGRAANV